jgi:hypothetical protein
MLMFDVIICVLFITHRSRSLALDSCLDVEMQCLENEHFGTNKRRAI